MPGGLFGSAQVNNYALVAPQVRSFGAPAGRGGFSMKRSRAEPSSIKKNSPSLFGSAQQPMAASQ
jgi:hypothetical protein